VFFSQCVCFAQTCLQFLLHRQRHLQSHWTHSFNQKSAYSLVDIRSRDMLTNPLSALYPFALAHIVRLKTLFPAMITNRHTPAAYSTDHQSLQQSWTFSWRALAAVGAVGRRVFGQAFLVLFEFVPRNVARMRIGNKRNPFLPR
jgi:hypothetical protein